MAVYKGDTSTIGYKIETAFDEAPVQGAQTTWMGIIPSADFDDAPEYKDYYAVGQGRNLFLENQGKIAVTGNLPLELQNGRPIYLALGTEVFAAGTPATHTLSGAATIPSICIEAVYAGANRFLRYYRGCKIDSLDIEAVDGAEVRATVALQAARSAKSTNTASTISSVTTTPFMYHQGCVTIDGYGTYDIATFKWSVKNNLKPRFLIKCNGEGKYAGIIVEGKRDYEITASVIIPDAATYNTKLYDTLLAGTTFTTTIVLARAAGTDDMTLTASNCTLRAAPHSIPEVGEAVEVSLTIKPRSCVWVVRDAIGTYTA